MKDKLSDPKKEIKPSVLYPNNLYRDQEERRNKIWMIKQIY